MSAHVYPLGRPQYWAMKAIRLLAKTSAANDITPTGFALLTVIATTEDAAYYKRPITFYDSQLEPMIGVTQKALAAARNKCVEEGWLHYEPGCKGRASRYWMLLPAFCDGVNDRDINEENPDIRRLFDGESETNTEVIVCESTAQRSSFLPSKPLPNPPPPKAVEWEEVERSMIEFGIGETSKPLRSLQDHGVEPGLALDVLRYATQTQLWKPGKVRQRLVVLLPGDDPTEKRLWMLPDFGQAHPAVQSESQSAATSADDAKRNKSRQIETQLLIEWEREYGPALDAMDESDLLELCPSDGIRHTLKKRGRKFKLVRDMLLRIIADQAS